MATPNPSGRVSATGSDISLITLNQDAGYILPAGQSDEPDSWPYQNAGTKTTDFPNEKMNFFKILADVLAVLLPFSLLGFILAIKRLDGKEVDTDSFETWQNAVRVVRCSPSFSIGSFILSTYD